MTVETTTPHAAEDLPEICEGCGQKLLLRAPGRTRCERCRLGRGPVEPEVKLRSFTKDLGEAVPCAGCGRTEVAGYDGVRKALADGYCVDCRVQGKHLS